MSDHPNHESLLAFLAGTLSADAAQRVEVHVEQCDECARRLIDVSQHGELENWLRRRAAEAGDRAGEVEDFVKRLKAIGPPARDSRADSTAAYVPAERSVRLKCPHCGHAIQVVAETSPAELTCDSCGSSFHFDRSGFGGSLATTRDQRVSGAEPASAGFPHRIGKFRVLELLGRGGFGSVYKARDEELARDVAIKIPRAGTFGSPEEEAMFFREARSAAQLRHGGIVQVYEVSPGPQQPFIVSEFIDGCTLADVIRGGRPGFRETAGLVAEIADAVQYAHQHGVIHRDLKPQNILIDHAGRPHVADFGLARRDEGEITITLDGMVLGTPAYMSPEQAAGEHARVGPHSDVYSLGVMLFELLTGEIPFRGSKRMLLHKVIHDDPPQPRSLNDRIPRDLETIALKALAKSPTRRYATAADFAADLRRWLHGEPISARPVSQFERTWRWCRRHPARAALALTTLAAAAALAAFFVGLGYNAEQKRLKESAETSRDTAVSARQDADEKRREAELQRTRAQRLEASNERLAVLRLARRQLDLGDVAAGRKSLTRLFRDEKHLAELGFEAFHLWRECHTQARTGTCFEERPTWTVDQWAVSADGQVLAIAGHDGFDAGQRGVEIREAASFRLRRFLPLASPVKQPIALSVDGGRLATGPIFGEVLVWDTNTGQVLNRLPRAAGFDSLAFSPDWRRLVIGHQHWQSGGVNEVWDLATQSLQMKIRGGNKVAVTPDGKILVTWSNEHLQWFDMATGELRGEANVWPQAIAISNDSRHIATASGDQFVQGGLAIWDFASGAKLRSLHNPHKRGSKALAFSADNRWLLTSSWDELDSSIMIIDAGSGKVLETLLGHTISPELVTFRDESKVLAASRDGTMCEWDVRRLSQRPAARGNHFSINALAYSRDGSRLITGGWETDDHRLPGQVIVWNPITRQPIRTISGLRQTVFAIALSPDEQILATGGGEWDVWQSPGEIHLWDVATGQLKNTLTNDYGNVMGLAFSPDGGTLAVAAGKNVRLFDPKSTQPHTTLPGTNTWVYDAKYSPNGLWLAVGQGNGEIKIWDARQIGEPFTLSGHSNAVYGLAFSRDGRLLASASWDRTARIWDVASRTQRGVLKSDKEVTNDHEQFWSIAFSPDGKTVATGAGQVKLWDVETSKLKITRQVTPVWTTNMARCVAFSPDGQSLAVGGRDNLLRLWDANLTSQTTGLERGHSFAITSIAFPRAGNVFATSGFDLSVKLWDAATEEQLATLAGHTSYVTQVAMSPDGNLLASASHDRTIKLWDVPGRQELATLTGHDGWVKSVAFSPDGKWLASAGALQSDGINPAPTTSSRPQVLLWDVASRQAVATFDGGHAATFSPDGNWLATGANDVSGVAIWDLATKTRRRVLSPASPAGGLLTTPVLAFFPDSKSLVTGALVWDVETGEQLRTLDGHGAAICSVTFSPDGKTIATGSEDDTIILWNANTGQERFRLEGHADNVCSVAFSPDGRTLVSGSGRDFGQRNLSAPAELRFWRTADRNDVVTELQRAENRRTALSTARAEWQIKRDTAQRRQAAADKLPFSNNDHVLLRDPLVQIELRLDHAQRRGVMTVADSNEQNWDVSLRVAEILSASQQRRLAQIALQQSQDNPFARGSVPSALDLSADQRKQLNELWRNRASGDQRGLFEKTNEILTSNQRQKWTDLLGPWFELHTIRQGAKPVAQMYRLLTEGERFNEIALRVDQGQKLRDLAYSAAQEIGNNNPSNVQIKQLTAAYDAVLDPEQSTRLDQLDLQDAGPLTGLLRDDVANQLSLSDEQKSKLATIAQELKRLHSMMATPDSPTGYLASGGVTRQAAADERALALLKPEQLRQWQARLGPTRTAVPEIESARIRYFSAVAWILGRRGVQFELNLTETQMTTINRLTAEADATLATLPVNCGRLAEIRRRFESAVAATLDTQQVARIKQVERRRKFDAALFDVSLPVSMLFDQYGVAGEESLTADPRQLAAKLESEAMQAFFRTAQASGVMMDWATMFQIRQTTSDRILAEVLTADQRSQWRQSLGLNAPDFSAMKAMHHDDFSDPTSGLGAGETGGVARGYQNGRYFIRPTQGGAFGWNVPAGNKLADFSCEVVGQVAGRALGRSPHEHDGWGVCITNQANQNCGVQVVVRADGSVDIRRGTFDADQQAGPHLKPVFHSAVRPALTGGQATAFNKLLVQLRGQTLDVFVNDVRIHAPIELGRDVTPGVVALLAVANGGGEAQFDRITLWPHAE